MNHRSSMKKLKLVFALLISSTILLSACIPTFLLEPTQTATATETLKPTNTLTQTPTNIPTSTNTPIPTSTHTKEPSPTHSKIIKNLEGEYSFLEPNGFIVNIKGPMVGITNEEQTFSIIIYGSSIKFSLVNLYNAADNFLNLIFQDPDGYYIKENAQSIMIDSVEGLIFDITGSIYETMFKGQAVIVMPKKNQFFFGLGLANVDFEENLWDDEGKIIFKTLISSIGFLTEDELSTSSICTISTDKTYGYSEENPIRVGGDAFGGPSRERAYLDNLLGPNGEQLTYERIGSFETDDTILDEFIIKGAGKTIILYIDEYSYSVPMAPVGFTCYKDFPFSKPQS